MEFSWTTLILEVINFLVLLWILKRFLYAPILRVLDQRRAGVLQTLADAHATREQAEAMQQQFASRLAAWEQEKTGKRSQLEDDLARERERQLQKLLRDLDAERESRAAQDRLHLESRQQELQSLADERSRQFASRLLARLAAPDLEIRLGQLFIEELQQLPESSQHTLRNGLDGQTQARVSSAFALPENIRSELLEVLSRQAGRNLTGEFFLDPALIAGVRVILGGTQLDFSLAGELQLYARESSLAHRD
jgi:F-type H+-transporting ATPase subunit b